MCRCSLAILVGVAASSLPAVAQSGRERFADLFALNRIVDLQVSPDGRWVVAATVKADPERNVHLHTLWLVATDGRTPPMPLGAPEHDSTTQWAPGLSWAPDGSRVGFVSERSGTPQVWTVDVPTAVMRPVTQVRDGVNAFAWSPDGRQVALMLRHINSPPDAPPSRTGVVMDPSGTNVYSFLGSPFFEGAPGKGPPPTAMLAFLTVATSRIDTVSDVTEIDRLLWAPSGRALALRAGQSGPVVYDLPTHAVRTLSWDGAVPADSAAASGASATPTWARNGAPAYRLLSWPQDDRIYVLKTAQQKTPWDARKAILEVNLRTHTTRARTPFKPWYLPAVWAQSNGTLLVENTVRGVRQLLRITDDTMPRPLSDTTASLFLSSFARGERTVAFVRESFRAPPEIYVAATADLAHMRRLTHWNDSLRSTAEVAVPRAVSWTSTDGAPSRGWVLMPAGTARRCPCPTLVFVHGGPTYAIHNRFNPYSVSSMAGWEGAISWPYPWRDFVKEGYAVFLPNYRGTGTYEPESENVENQEREPAEDIVTGVQYLIQAGIADSARLGIFGHSHGGWLGPYIMTHYRLFKAASFAEGATNWLAVYGQLAGGHGLYINDYYLGHGVSPYQDPERWIRMSPAFHLQGITTPTLVEAGGQSGATFQMDFAHALWRMGVPHEFVLYPLEDHGLLFSQAQRESAEHNLEWFNYWLLGERDPDPTKRSQYERWERMAKDMTWMRAHNAPTAPAAAQ